MNWEEAKMWMRLHPGGVLADSEGEHHRFHEDGGPRERRIPYPWADRLFRSSREEFPERTFIIYRKASLLHLHTIGRAVDWLLENPDLMLVDSDGDFWRADGMFLELHTQGMWVDAPIRVRKGLTWQPALRSEIMIERKGA